MLTSLSMFGETYLASLYPDRENKKRIDALEASVEVEVLN